MILEFKAKNQAILSKNRDMAELSHSHTVRQCFSNQTGLEDMSTPRAKQEKKSRVGLNFDKENLVGQRICALLNLGLLDLPDPILKRITASRKRALEMHKDRSS